MSQGFRPSRVVRHGMLLVRREGTQAVSKVPTLVVGYIRKLGRIRLDPCVSYVIDAVRRWSYGR